LGCGLKITEVAHIFGLLFSTATAVYKFLLKNGWATFWATFSHTYSSGHPGADPISVLILN
jgi:hypothetical protein